jgi:predicted alpha/beta-fold hydrolase
LLDGYRAPRWLPGGHAQTLYAALIAPRPRVAYDRERWDTPDGDFIEVDRLAPWRESAPGLVVLFHGLEGCSLSHYAQALMAHARELGFNGLVVHFRGCGGRPNRLPRAYHSGDSAEADWIIRHARRLYPEPPLHAVGVSLGGNVLLKWLGEQGDAATALLAGAAAISAPVDLSAAGENLGRGFNRLYTRAFLRTLKRKSIATLREFDDVVTAPLHGFRDTDDYWTRSSSKPLLARIAVPTLMVNARNDPFLPASALPAADEVSTRVTLEFPAEGGHVGFVSGAFPGRLDWLPRRIMRFFQPRRAESERTLAPVSLTSTAWKEER